MQLDPTSAAKSGAQGESWLDRVLDRISAQPSAPERPSPPPVDQPQWDRSVDSHKINTLIIHDVESIVFNETRSFTDSDSANDSMSAGREKVAHAIMNGDSQLGQNRPSTVGAIEPTVRALRNPRTKQAYNSSMAAARDAYLSLQDPTRGATHFQFLPNSDRTNMKFKHGTPEGVPLKTQSGPFSNSYFKNHVKSDHVYVNTYGQK
jgi:hypothetical protein